ncbi:WSSV519 [White spot syndrome virus]|uniref:WSSV519 n=1 Tax=White spot syndrome virus TaxID=342409 RepID=A0A2I6SCG6_9VIRU|nr:WSSV519 [White spot syndrome virus]
MDMVNEVQKKLEDMELEKGVIRMKPRILVMLLVAVVLLPILKKLYLV